jgi:hypothetical protein
MRPSISRTLRRRQPHPLHAIILMAAVALLGGCAAHQSLPISDVVAMSEQKRAAEPIIAKIRSAKTTYALKGSDYGKLQDAHVSAPVLDYLQQAFVDDVDLLTRYWVTGESLGGCKFCYPQEVDLSGLSTGQALKQQPPYTSYVNNQPEGMPSWYRPITLSPKGTAVSIDDIREMVRQGKSQAEILEALNTKGLETIIIQTDTKQIRTRPLAAITGSELAQLRADGVPDPVLDAIQNSFLSQFVALERLRYINIGKGSVQS